jgi:DNA-binding winged helix-turn-helix (wHTH) protein
LTYAAGLGPILESKNALRRRSSAAAEAYRFGQFTLEPAERRLCADGVPVPLGSTDFHLLLALVENAGSVVAKDDLVSRV